MTLSSKQFDTLSAMGISLWQSKNTPTNVSTNTTTALTIDKTKLQQSKLFSDILLSLNYNFADIEINPTTIEFSDFSWQFTNNKELSFKQQRLITPTLETLAHSSALKQQLWHLFTDYKNTL